MRVRGAIAVFPIVGLLFCARADFNSIHVYAFAVTGHQWHYQEGGVQCGPYSGAGWVACAMGLTLTSNITNRSGWSTTATDAAGGWYAYDSSRSRLDFEYLINSYNDVNMDAKDLGGRNGQGVIVLGTTSWWWDGVGELTFAQIYVTTNSQVSFCTDLDTSCDGKYSLHHIMEHELGHALGLAHPVAGPNSWAVMECMQAYGELSGVQSDDSHGEFYLYSGHGSDYGSPGSSPC